MDTLYIDYAGPAYPTLAAGARWAHSAALNRVLDRVQVDSGSRRNPRTSDYMMRVIAELTGGEPAHVMRVGEDAPPDIHTISAARGIVLLWHDANGCGWSGVERLVFRYKQRSTTVRVINGRRREFALTPSRRRQFLVRRFLEKSLLVEIGLILAFAVLSPLLVGWDVLRGRH